MFKRLLHLRLLHHRHHSYFFSQHRIKRSLSFGKQSRTMTGESGAEYIAQHAERGDEGRGGNRGRGRGRGGRGGRGGGRGGGGEMNREVAISKALSKLLRHAAEEAGLKLDEQGFARVDQVLAWPRLKSLQVTFDDIKLAVADNAKQRFSMKPVAPSASATSSPPPAPPAADLTSQDPRDWLIRANQGHSIALDSASLLVPLTLEAGNIPPVVVHGTYFAFWTAIVASGGLRRMTRNHIHFSTGLPEEKAGGGGVISGMRADAEVLIYVDVEGSLRDGIRWWMSENGVVLTEGDERGVLASRYFQLVRGRREDVGVLWVDGEETAELPVRFRERKAPVGKVHRPRGGENGGRGGGRGGHGHGRRGGRGAGDQRSDGPSSDIQS